MPTLTLYLNFYRFLKGQNFRLLIFSFFRVKLLCFVIAMVPRDCFSLSFTTAHPHWPELSLLCLKFEANFTRCVVKRSLTLSLHGSFCIYIRHCFMNYHYGTISKCRNYQAKKILVSFVEHIVCCGLTQSAHWRSGVYERFSEITRLGIVCSICGWCGWNAPENG